MKKTNLEIKCLARLDELTASCDSIMEFLVGEELMTKEQRKAFRNSADIPKVLQGLLASLMGSKIQLLTYEWTMLPDERLRVTIVTDRNNREFSFNF